MPKRKGLIFAALAAVIAPLTVMAPAHAAIGSFTDPVNDTGSGLDIRSVRVSNSSVLRVTTHVRRIVPGSIAVWIDTNPSLPGPDYGLFSGVGTETDWTTATVRNWRAQSMTNCYSKVSWAYSSKNIHISLGRGCFGHARSVRVSVRTGVTSRADDWAPGFHAFGPWVAYTAPATTPAFYSCAQKPYRRMANFNFACGDGNAYFDRATWRTWTTTQATGTARQWYNTCKPSCSAGNYRYYNVSVRFFRPATVNGHQYFSRATITGTHGYTTLTPTP